MARPSWHFEPRWAAILLLFFLLALLPRLYGGLTFGAGLDGPGTFQVVNYDEAGGCRAILGTFNYSSFVGHQVLAIARLTGQGPPAGPLSNREARSYCFSRPVIMLHRAYSAVTGALAVVLVGLLALMMWPTRPPIAWTACVLLALSNLHVAWSSSGTVDAPQVFFIYLLITLLAYGLVSRTKWPLFLSPVFLIGAIWTKWYFFAVFVYAAFVRQLASEKRTLRYSAVLVGVLGLVAFLIGWEDISGDIGHRASALLWGKETSKFGTGYGNIGTWRRWVRNVVNLPLVHLVGLGLPACLFVWNGVRRSLADRDNWLLWLLHAPALVYAAYMVLLGPVTYYRHYLPFLPLVVLLAAYGFWESRWSKQKLFVVLFLLYPLLLTLDSGNSFRNDPRRELRPWYASRNDPKILTSYYVVPPKNARAALFDIDDYLRYGERYLKSADYVILSENWYDTAYPNELNGPITWNPEWLIKTKPEYAVVYRRIISGEDPNLALETEFNLKPFMPELVFHRYFYGSFQRFVGDVKVFRVVP